MKSNKTILYYSNDNSALEVLTLFARKHQCVLRRADDIVDVYACSNDIGVIQRDVLDEQLFCFLKEVYIDELSSELHFMKDDRAWEFTDRWIVFGEGIEIPSRFKRFFVEVASLDESIPLSQFT